MGPERAAVEFENRNKSAAGFKVVLFGSLAKTGKGHGTDEVLKKTFSKPAEIIFDCKKSVPHPNTMDFFAIDADGTLMSRMRVFSVGGGAVKIEGENDGEPDEIYPHNSFSQIKNFCEQNSMNLLDYVVNFEGKAILDYFDEIWQAMRESVEEGLNRDGVLPGGLNTERKAKTLFLCAPENETDESRESRLICAFAFAVAEQNASGERVVTAPTCGACGILPAVLYYEQEKNNLTKQDIYYALAAAGITGNLVKTNASISGAECGCQAECGTACSMTAAAVAALFGLGLGEIEYAAEIAMEHNLGLTCDPVDGLVQIPCIERNAVTAMRAMNAARLAAVLTPSHKVSFDDVVDTMYETGKDMNARYRETAKGGLARLFRIRRKK